MLSYQDISTENCPCQTGARGSPAFELCENKRNTRRRVRGKQSSINVEISTSSLSQQNVEGEFEDSEIEKIVRVVAPPRTKVHDKEPGIRCAHELHKSMFRPPVRE